MVNFVERKVVCTGKWSILSNEKYSVLVQGQFCPSIQTEKKGDTKGISLKLKLFTIYLTITFTMFTEFSATTLTI